MELTLREVWLGISIVMRWEGGEGGEGGRGWRGGVVYERKHLDLVLLLHHHHPSNYIPALFNSFFENLEDFGCGLCYLMI